MAEALLKTRDSFSCPVCLDVLKNPVTIPCGHSFCLGCIKNCWDQDDLKGVYSCPQCRQNFTPRPVLNKNTILAELAESLRKTRLQAAPPADAPADAPSDAPAGSGDVKCDICTGTKLRAVKSCLVCLLSFCETHIRPHCESPGYKKHKLVEASRSLQEKICSLHDKLLEVFCHTDQKCICLLCTLDNHKGHDTISAASERINKLYQLEQNREDCKQRNQQKEKNVQELKEVMEKLKSSAQAAVDETDKIFTDLIQSLERRRSEVTELIRAQEKTDLSQAEELLKKVKQDIADLRRRDAELEQLSHTEDPIHFLQCFQFLPALPGFTNLSTINTRPQFSIDFLKKRVSEMEKLNAFRKLEIVKTLQVHTVQPTEPKTRKEFLKYSCQLTLNPYMINNYLRLSEGNKKVNLKINHNTYYTSQYPQNWCQVLCAEPLSERSYWEVEISGNVSVAVTHKDISSEEKVIANEFGANDQSWSLECCDYNLTFRHNSQVCLNVQKSSSKLGVYVDHMAGILSFYCVSNTMTLLHRVQTSFTQTLYAGFGMKQTNSSVKIL